MMPAADYPFPEPEENGKKEEQPAPEQAAPVPQLPDLDERKYWLTRLNRFLTMDRAYTAGNPDSDEPAILKKKEALIRRATYDALTTCQVLGVTREALQLVQQFRQNQSQQSQHAQE